MRILFVFAALGCSISAVKAQIIVNVKGGINIANERHKMTEENSANLPDVYFSDNIVNAFGGVSGEHQIVDNLWIELAIMYLQMGHTTKYHGYFFGIRDERHQYLSVPVSVKHYLGNNVSIFAGPYVSYLLDASTSSLTREDFQADLDIGLQFGSEFNIYRNMGLGFSYFAGLKNTENYSFEDRKNYNRSLQLYVFYKFKPEDN